MANKNNLSSPPPYPGTGLNAGPSSSQANRPAMVLPNYGYATPAVVYVQTSGNCSRGGDHVFTTEFTLGGLLCALFFFPLGIVCCLCLTERRCVKCSGRFD
ncbi:hypothetical protein DSO57_1026247 [Entomophthora muscae]|uniref:Uncharacterized protein n=1 Tax=Entomophthora muscae TaxID=34485 RepID=A0ACC2UMZ4_9FUNG|nr:hypothetical protein DSO57_1026247 [Entomophthora muscae]